MGPAGLLREVGPAGLLREVGPAGLLREVGPAGLLREVGPAGLLTGCGPARLLPGVGSGGLTLSIGPARLTVIIRSRVLLSCDHFHDSLDDLLCPGPLSVKLDRRERWVQILAEGKVADADDADVARDLAAETS